MERGVFANSVRKRSGTDSSRRATAAIWTPAAQPSVRCREDLDFGLVQLDSELGDDGGDFGLRESEFGVAHLEQLSMRTKSVAARVGARFGFR